MVRTLKCRRKKEEGRRKIRKKEEGRRKILRCLIFKLLIRPRLLLRLL
ncbi:MAG: hypothetical protein F6K39_26255 [Okeania sp. SIO3B3]|nr:hypothetical protein [Okeania sp. SIO3B3]